MLGNAIVVNPELGEPPTGEPDAGDPHVRFGGRGSSRSPYPYPEADYLIYTSSFRFKRTWAKSVGSMLRIDRGG
jgi:hypothetical protein